MIGATKRKKTKYEGPMGAILVIDSDEELTALLAKYLQGEGFQTTCVHDGESGIKKALNQSFDAIILEITLPKCNGFLVLKSIREHLQTPVLLLTDRNEMVDKIVGFEIGADDYLTKPCNPEELIARLHTILKRSPKLHLEKPILQHHAIFLDTGKRIVTMNNTPLELTNAEFNILEILLKSPGQAFSKEELTQYALGRKYTAFDRSIDVHISNLRNKLKNNPRGDPWIKTVRGFGYLLTL